MMFQSRDNREVSKEGGNTQQVRAEEKNGRLMLTWMASRTSGCRKPADTTGITENVVVDDSIIMFRVQEGC